MKIYFFALGLLALFCLTSCQKELDPSVLNGSGNNNNDATRNSYLPLTTGTWWKYRDTASGALGTLTVTSVEKIKNNRTFRGLIENSPGRIDTSWWAVDGPSYFQHLSSPDPSGGPSYDVLFHFLNDTATVGRSWTYMAGQGNGFTAYITTTTEEKGISVTVQGKTYPDVIHTRMDLDYDILGVILNFARYDLYLAKGVGIIRSRAETDQGGMSIKACRDLVDHHIQ